MTGTGQDFEPKIIAFLCAWCSYAAADKAGRSQNPYPHTVSVIRVMCSGRVDPQFILSSFKKGADGVIILACHPGDCHYKGGNIRAIRRHRLLVKMLEQFGIQPERCRCDYVSAAEGDRFIELITGMVAAVKALGPLRVASGSSTPAWPESQ